MTTLRPNGRLQVGSAPWILEEKSSALQMADSEVEEFSFSAKNELDWLNEHMAQIFDENQLNVTELFKTPGKLRGKTPRTARKQNPLETRAPLSDIFSATPRGAAPNLFRQQPQDERQVIRFKVAEDTDDANASARKEPPPPKPILPRAMYHDSGYHGSQASFATDVLECSPPHQKSSPMKSPSRVQQLAGESRKSDDRRTTEESFQSAKENQTVTLNVDIRDVEISQPEPSPPATTPSKISSSSRVDSDTRLETKESPEKPSPPHRVHTQTQENEDPVPDSKQSFEDIHSPSEGSSPIRPIRHSSLSFATLPPREPLTTNAKKSFGNRTSRTSHLDRTSYYGRNTGGKSLGGHQVQVDQDDEEINTDVDMPDSSTKESDGEFKVARLHSKTSTQRLQDQISMLGKLQTNVHRPSKSIPSMIVAAPQKETQHESPIPTETKMSAPGAFPVDEDDDWIGPPNPSAAGPSIFSPRKELPKSHTLAIMNGFNDEDDVFNVPKERSPMHYVQQRPESPLPLTKYATTSVVPSPSKGKETTDLYMKKGISVSNPDLASASERDAASSSRLPFKSPTKSARDSPLKAAKDKISSILKTSRGLFASSAAVSAEAHSSTLPAPSSRPAEPATQDVKEEPAKDEPLYPLLRTESIQAPASPSKHGPAKRTRASTEREEKRKEKEAKEARLMNEQLEKLEKLREQESQKAKVFSQEQERVTKMQKPSLMQSPKASRSSPRKTKAQLEAEGRAAAAASSTDGTERDAEMVDALKDMPPPPPSNPRPASQLSKNNKEYPKRITKPTIAPPTRGPKAAPVPVHIKVHTGVHGGPHRNPLHPSNSALASSLGDSLTPAASRPGPALKHKASVSSIKSTASTTSTTRRPAALTAAARAKEQHEREAQRRRDLNLENQRKRAALEEERRQEQQRLEAEKQREKQRAQAEASKNAQRQLLERAKAERPPPPAARPLTANNNPGYSSNQDKPLPPPPPHRAEPSMSRPQRMNSMMHRPLDETDRAGILGNMAKAPPKRPLPQDNDDSSRPTLQRNGPSYADKRRKTEDQNGEATDVQPRPAMAPPVRQSGIRPIKDGQSKSIFANGYASVPHSHGVPTLLQQATRPQQQKPAHPLDMVHNSKAPINFAPNPAQAGGPHKTPARPVVGQGGKSTVKASAKSSPRYQNGDSIDLPEINTDSEDDDSDAGGNDFPVPEWANSPNLVSGLVAQESLDPMTIFGPPSELKMEEVFKNKERWGRFRQRTSSANWSGSDRLTDEDIRRNQEARERLRREGGWSYGLS